MPINRDPYAPRKRPFPQGSQQSAPWPSAGQIYNPGGNPPTGTGPNNVFAPLGNKPKAPPVNTRTLSGHNYATIIPGFVQVPVGGQPPQPVVLAHPNGYRNYLNVYVPILAGGQGVYVGFRSVPDPLTANVYLPNGTGFLWDFVVPQDDMYVLGDGVGNAVILTFSYSNIDG